jgi:hypothetical protein
MKPILFSDPKAMVVITVVVIFYTFFNSFHVESELLLQTAVAPLAIQQAIVNTMFAVAPWARQQVYVIHGQMLWPLGRDNACWV